MEQLIELCQSATGQHRCWQRMHHHLLSQLVCLGRHTLTGVTATTGAAFRDWSAQYRLCSQARFDPEAVFGVVRQQLEQQLSPEEPLVVAMDDSLLRKTGTHIPGVSRRRDPLGPRFQVNFIQAQRILQLSAALPEWRAHKLSRASTQNLIGLLRQELWADAITSRNFPHFRTPAPRHQKSRKLLPNLKGALFYASN